MAENFPNLGKEMDIQKLKEAIVKDTVLNI